jgi:gluconolactonase
VLSAVTEMQIPDVDSSPIRWPDPRVRVLDDRFVPYVVGHSAVERIATGYHWAEGPVWFGDHGVLVWSDLPNNRMMQYVEATGQVSVFRSHSNFSNGNTRDRQGRLVSCEHQTSRVTRTEYDGSISVLADNIGGKQFNSPNDVVVGSDDAIWFSDPTFGLKSLYEGGCGRRSDVAPAVYRIDGESGDVVPEITDVLLPNGIAFSTDGSLLYVAEDGTDPMQIRAYPVRDGHVSGRGRTVVASGDGGLPDGFRLDELGNIWCGWGEGEGKDGVRVFAPDGTLIGAIDLPECCANVCFGGRGRNRLFMAASQSVYSVYVNVRGAQTW